MFSKRFVFNCIIILTVIAGIGACTPSATTDTPIVSLPDTHTPELAVQTDTPSPTIIEEPIPAPANCRQNIVDPTKPIHAVHMGGNWGFTYEPQNTLPDEYFEYLEGLNVNWVGISVALHYDDSMDSTVERVYSNVQIPTFSDAFLKEMIRTYHQHGICVYLTLAFEASEAEESVRPVIRYQLGEPRPLWGAEEVVPEFWPWDIIHPDHERFVTEFWESYTQQSVHFGQLAEQEGVALYSLGTETEGLFRTRPSDNWPNDFSSELRTMVASVREVYSGPLTYDMLVFALFENDPFGPGSEYLWEDLDLDVIGLSAYFQLADLPPTSVLSVEKLEESWEIIFQNYLIPLQMANPDRPIYFAEFGATDSVRSPYEASVDSFACRIFQDQDENRLDDGEETQANIYQALLNVMDNHPGVVSGTFLWGMEMADDEQAWAFYQTRGLSVRDKLSEDIVRDYYGAAPRTTLINKYEEIPTPSPNEDSLFIYDDVLVDGWEIASWEAEIDTAVESVVRSGPTALGVMPTSPGGNVTFINLLDISAYAYLEFYVNGGSLGGQSLNIIFWDNEKDKQVGIVMDLCPYIKSETLPPDKWMMVRLPLQHLNFGSGQYSIIIFDDDLQFFLDDIRLVRGVD
jgi:hypothetical protein